MLCNCFPPSSRGGYGKAELQLSQPYCIPHHTGCRAKEHNGEEIVTETIACQPKTGPKLALVLETSYS
jgi:hypothetical protein